jgi:hypothetical protein
MASNSANQNFDWINDMIVIWHDKKAKSIKNDIDYGRTNSKFGRKIFDQQSIRLGVSVSGSVPKYPEPILTLCRKVVKGYENIPLCFRNA